MTVVYFLQCSLTRRVKIGCTEDLTTRILAINSANCAPARLIAVISGGVDVETYLHQRFASDRLNGEWFRPSEDLSGLAEAACFGRFPYREVAAPSRQQPRDYSSALAEAKDRLKAIGDELPRATAAEKRAHASIRTGISASRVFDLWYSKARSISPEEASRIEAVRSHLTNPQPAT